jgi:hypothetical protein
LHRTRSILVALLCTLGFASIAPTSVLASCNPMRFDNDQYYWVGRDQTAAATGIRSLIKIYAPYVKDGFSYSWVWLGGNGNYMWAQVGPYQYATGRTTHLQYAWPNQFRYLNFGAYGIGSSVEMKVLYFGQEKKFYFFADGHELFNVYRPEWSPTGARISGEMTTFANQMMGAINNKEVFSGNQIQYGGATHTYSGSVVPYNTNILDQSGTGGSFSIWDKGCFS